jgi:hypothetical protein
MPVIPLAVPARDGGVGADPVTYAHALRELAKGRSARWHRDTLAGPANPLANDRCLETAGKLPCGLSAATPEFQ